MLKQEGLLDILRNMAEEQLQHTNMQYWFPNDQSENHFYTNSDIHGAVLSRLSFENCQNLLQILFDECNNMVHHHKLSAVRFGQLPLILMACRHYRYPVPLHVIHPPDHSDERTEAEEME